GLRHGVDDPARRRFLAHRRGPVPRSHGVIMSEASDILAEVPLFALLDDQERAVLAERVDVARFESTKTIFRRGDPGDALFVVKTGEVEISVQTDSGETLVLEHAKPGDFFGEVSLLDGGARTATATAR